MGDKGNVLMRERFLVVPDLNYNIYFGSPLCFSKYFEGFIMIVIILNVVLLAMPYLGNSLEYT